MSNLISTYEKNRTTIDSREISEMTGKEHSNLMRDIRGYIDAIQKSTDSKLNPLNFFIESTYIDGKGEERPCYLITKPGCEFIGNKLTGNKGILFTAAYVTKFNEMESQSKALPACMEDIMIAQLQEMKIVKQQVHEVDNRVEKLENTMTIDYTQQEVIRELANRRVVEALGGKSSGAYKEIRSKAFAEFWSYYKRVMQVNSYKNTATKDFDKAKEVIQGWQPENLLELAILGSNTVKFRAPNMTLSEVARCLP